MISSLLNKLNQFLIHVHSVLYESCFQFLESYILTTPRGALEYNVNGEGGNSQMAMVVQNIWRRAQ